MPTPDPVRSRPRPKVDPGLIITIVIGCIVATFVLRYTAKSIPKSAVGGIASQLATDAEILDKPESTFEATGDVRGVGFAANGNIFVGDRDSFTLRDPKSGNVLTTFDTEDNGVRAIAVSPSGNSVAVSLSYAGEVRLYDAGGDAKPLLTFHSASDQEQQSVIFSADGDSVAAGGFDKTVRVWSAAGATGTTTPGAVFDTTKKTGSDGKLLAKTIKVGDSINAVAFAGDGKTIAVATGPKVTIYDIATGKAGKSFFAEKDTVTATTFSPDSKQIAVGAASGNIHFFEIATGRTAGMVKGGDDNGSTLYTGHNGYGVTALCYAPQGKMVYATQKSGLLQGIDTATSKIKKVFAEEKIPAALSLATSTDGTKAVVGYGDGSVRVWKL